MSLVRFRFLPLALAAALVATLMNVVPAYGAGPAEMDPNFAKAVQELAPDTKFGAFVHFSGGSTAEQTALLQARGLTVTNTFPSVDVVFAVGTVRRLSALREVPGVVYLEADRKLVYLGNTAPIATRVRAVQADPATYKDAEGNVLDGRGIGVAIIDSGIDATHPDLTARVARNFKVVCSTPLLRNGVDDPDQCLGPMVFPEGNPYNDTTGGHGTHVAGIVAGDGTASSGKYRGVAYGASLFGYSVGETISVLYNVGALNHIVENYDTLVPRIRAVNNSYGETGGAAFDPNSVATKVTNRLVSMGVSVVYAAGNDGGNGTADRTSSYSKNPTPGVISAANYNDQNTGTRDGVLNSSSSRGKAGADETYPDLSAPGTSITATCRPTMPVCATGPTTDFFPNYANLTGTSMATPHIAGAAALVYQAYPGITPAEIEDVFQDTAYKYTNGAPYEADAQNADATTSYDKGAGLLDLQAALNDLAGGGGTDPSPTPSVSATPSASPAPAGPPFVGEGVIQLSNPGGVSATRQEFAMSTCPEMPSNQGLDSVVFELPQNFNAASAVAVATGPSGTAYNLYYSIFAGDCTFQRHENNDAVSETGVLDAASKFISVGLNSGKDIPVTLTVTPQGSTGPTISPSPTPSPSVTVSPTPTETVTASPSPTPTEPPVQTTTVSFTGRSATRGQFSDNAHLEASLVDEAGHAISDEELVFRLESGAESVAVSATTDERGIAAADIPLLGAPGEYDVAAIYAGQADEYLASSDAAVVTVVREDSLSTLVLQGKGSKRNLHASLSDADTSVAVISGALLEFFANGESIGTATTNDSGTASFTPPSKYRGGSYEFEVRFAGDTYYLPSSAARST